MQDFGPGNSQRDSQPQRPQSKSLAHEAESLRLLGDLAERGWAGQTKLLSNGCGFENDENMCLLPDLHYKLIMNQKSHRRGKTEALSA